MRVLVSLDALLDTRLATVSRLDQQAACRLLQHPDYYTRQIDDFASLCGIDRERFAAAYAQRDVETLKRSLITHIPFMLHELMRHLELSEDDTPFETALGLDVNVWPYELSEAESDALTLAVMVRAGHQTIPRVVRIAPEALTPARIKSEYSGMILYDLREWLQHHVEAFAAIPCPRVTVLVPALFHERIPEPEEYLTEGIRRDVSPFELTRLGAIEMVGLDFIRPSLFSIYQPAHDVRRE